MRDLTFSILILMSMAVGQAAVTQVGAPVDDQGQTNASASIYIPVLMNDPRGSELLSVGSARAAVQNGQIFYTPAGFTGNDTFNYTTQGGTATVTVAVTEAPPTPQGGGPPVDDAIVTEINESVSIRVLDNDPVGSLLMGINNPPVALPNLMRGTAVISGNLIRYTPPEDFIGVEQITYQTQTGTATVSVSTVNTIGGSTATVLLRNEFNTTARFRVTTSPGVLINPLTGARVGFVIVAPMEEVEMLVDVTGARQTVGFEAIQTGVNNPLSASATGEVATSGDTEVIFTNILTFPFVQAALIILSPP